MSALSLRRPRRRPLDQQSGLVPVAAEMSPVWRRSGVVRNCGQPNLDLIDILIVAEGITLENVYSALDPVEAELDRKISPTLYGPEEFAQRKASNNPFLTRVLAGKHLVLMGNL